MSVRIAKSAVNIREKLAELERPIGLNGSSLMRTETPQEAMSILGIGRKNILINGHMVIDQRNSGSSLSVSALSSPYSVDRWRVDNGSGAVLTAQRIADGPSGFSNCLSATITTADTDLTSNYLVIQQRIEGFNTVRLGWGTSQAKYATLSFYVKSNLTGQYGGSIRDADDATSSYTFSYSINSANIWEYKTITIPPRTTDTWLTNNLGSIDVIFSLATGSYLAGNANSWNSGNYLTVPNCVNFAQNVNNNFRITGIQLEEGKVATPFEYRNYGEELALCQRYCQSLGSGRIAIGNWGGPTGAVVTSFLFTEMRTTPTIYSYTSGNCLVETVAWYSVGNVSITESSRYTVSFSLNSITNSGQSANANAIWGNGASVVLQAEL